jgi:hypothetical protein
VGIILDPKKGSFERGKRENEEVFKIKYQPNIVPVPNL